MQRTPIRRPFDHHHPSQDGFGGNSKLQSSSLTPLEPEDGLGLGEDTALGESLRSSGGSESPSKRAIRERAVDFWKVGDSMRIMHHIEPKKYRSIALHGDVYQGFYIHDWSNVEHVKKARGRYPANRRMVEAAKGPYPQGETQEEINRNRNFAPSHGTLKLTGGVLRTGAQLQVP
jgi:hypothetical protein